MEHAGQFYIDGAWVAPAEPKSLDVIDPATEEPIGQVALGSAADVDRAVAAARRAFESYAETPLDDRVALIERIVQVYKSRFTQMGETISREMGAPLGFATRFQAGAGLSHFRAILSIMKDYPFEELHGTTLLRHEPIGVCGMITPWNWPANQITCKVAPALAAGCTMVLKPSEVAPFTGLLIAEILEEAGVPAGVFNLVNGEGPVVGQAIAAHPDVDMVSFTGSTRGGIEVARAAAPSVKRVGQELGGKSANIILDDADMEKAVADGVAACFRNSGQSCNAPSRMLVPKARMDEVIEIARTAADGFKVGDPRGDDTDLGPVVSEVQWKKIQDLIQAGVDEGAEVVAGGPGKPDGLNRGYYVRPTVFARADNAMTIAREEVFGPVLTIIGYADDADAVRIANDTPFGLSGYVQSASLDRARDVARGLRTAQVHLNGAGPDVNAPFGGYKQSGNGREWGPHGLEEYLEVKAVMGSAA
ncbi:MAG: aldehyde dehydrogenase family protein [Methyloligellaceae bacterium]